MPYTTHGHWYGPDEPTQPGPRLRAKCFGMEGCSACRAEAGLPPLEPTGPDHDEIPVPPNSSYLGRRITISWRNQRTTTGRLTEVTEHGIAQQMDDGHWTFAPYISIASVRLAAPVTDPTEPMSDERLAEIRADKDAMALTEVVELLAEVERLRAERDGLRRGRDSVRKHNYAAHQILTDALKADGIPPQQRPTLDKAATVAARRITAAKKAETERDQARELLAAYCPPGRLAPGEIPALCPTCTQAHCVPGLPGCASCVADQLKRLDETTRLVDTTLEQHQQGKSSAADVVFTLTATLPARSTPGGA
jgi:hypothetical protein